MMFREIVRKKQALPKEECIKLLKEEPRGVLSVTGDEGYPYGMPMNHYYDGRDGRIYFHSGMSGHKIDAMRACDKASFCVFDKGYRREGEWALNIRSVIVFGRIRFVDDYEKAMEISRLLSYKFTNDEAYINREIEHSGRRTQVFYLEPEHITGKLVNEA